MESGIRTLVKKRQFSSPGDCPYLHLRVMYHNFSRDRDCTFHIGILVPVVAVVIDSHDWPGNFYPAILVFRAEQLVTEIGDKPGDRFTVDSFIPFANST